MSKGEMGEEKEPTNIALLATLLHGLCCHRRKVVRPHHSTPLAAAGSSLAARCSFAVRRLLCARSLLAARCSLASLAARRCSLCAPAVRCSLCVLAALAGPRFGSSLGCCCWLPACSLLLLAARPHARAHRRALTPPARARTTHARAYISRARASWSCTTRARGQRANTHMSRAQAPSTGCLEMSRIDSLGVSLRDSSLICLYVLVFRGTSQCSMNA